MKIEFDRIHLSKAASLAASIAPKSSNRPAIVCGLLSVDDDDLTVEATDLTVSIRTPIQGAKIIEPGDGKLLVPIAKLAAIAHQAECESIFLHSEDNSIQIQAGNDRFHLYTIGDSNFPTAKPLKGPKFTVKADAITSLFGKVKFAAAKEAFAVYTYTGVNLLATSGKLEMTAVDPRRMSRAWCDVSGYDTTQKRAKASAIVPLRTLAALSRLPSDEDGMTVTFEDGRIGFESGETLLVSNLLEGNFPPVGDIREINKMQPESPHSIIINRASFLAAIRRASLFEDPEAGVKLRLTFSPGTGEIEIKNETPEAGGSDVRYPCNTGKADFTIGFNSTFLQDWLAAAESEDVTMELEGPNKPAIFKDTNYEYLVTPVALQEGTKP